MKIKSKRINFVPEFMIKEREQRRRMVITGITTLIITLLGFSIYFIPWFKNFSLEQACKNYNLEIEYADEENKLLNELKDKQDKLNKKRDLLSKLDKQEINIPLLLDKLAGIAPKEVIFSYLSVKENKQVDVRYSVNNPLEISNLAKNLEKLNIFEKVEIPNVPIVDRKTDVVFKLKLKDNLVKKEK